MAVGKRINLWISDWVGFAPFLLFCLLFELVPVLMLLRGSLVEKTNGAFTLSHSLELQQALYANSFINSIKLSGLTAIIGVVLGTFIGYAIYRGSSEWMRQALITLMVSILILWVGTQRKAKATGSVQAR